MATIILWLKRILAVGILEFLQKLGWRVWAGALLTFVTLAGLVIALTLIIVYLLL